MVEPQEPTATDPPTATAAETDAADPDASSNAAAATICAVCFDSTDLVLMPCHDLEESSQSTTRFCRRCIETICMRAVGGLGHCPMCRSTVCIDAQGHVAKAEPCGRGAGPASSAHDDEHLWARESRCCGCCCVLRVGLMWYCGVLLGMLLLGIYHFFDLQLASYPLTFKMREVVRDAEAFCADPETACVHVCECGGAPCDMASLARLSELGQYCVLAVHLLYIFSLATGLAGAAYRSQRTLSAFIGSIPTVFLLQLVPTTLLSIARPEPFLGWYLYNADSLGNPAARCTSEFASVAAGFRAAVTTFRWTVYLIALAINLHMGFTAHQTRRDLEMGAAAAASSSAGGSDGGGGSGGGGSGGGGGGGGGGSSSSTRRARAASRGGVAMTAVVVAASTMPTVAVVPAGGVRR